MWGRIRGWWPFAAITVFLLAAFWLLYVVWRSPDRSDLSTYGAFAAAVVTLVASGIAGAWAWRTRARPPEPPAAGQDANHLADLLAIAVQAQWERAANERGLVAAEPIPVTWSKPSSPMAGPVTAAAGSQRFDPLPGIPPVGEAELAAGQVSDLHAIYGGLRSGRLVIAGAPGSGKSGAAVLLVLATLKHRNEAREKDRTKIPVPVLFTAQNWEPRSQSVQDWLIGRLRETYPLFASRTGVEDAANLIDAGKVAVILDGLDEIPEELRPVALQALNQAGFRVVVLSRTAEMASAASQRGVLQSAAAIELNAINSSTAADYLERVQLDPPPEGWRDLVDRLRHNPRSPLANSLNSPLTLTLIRDTYQSGDDARELLDYCDSRQQRDSNAHAAEEITGHLLDRILPSAYAQQPGQPSPRYDLATAQSALAKIAAHMNKNGTRDLQWWHIPEWASSAQRVIVGGLGGLVAGLGAGVAAGVTAGVTGGNQLGAALAFGTPAGLAAGIVAGAGCYGSKRPPTRRGRLRLRRMFRPQNLSGGRELAVLLVTGVGFGFGWAAGSTSGIVAGPVV